MRKKVIAGNWKMNLSVNRSVELVEGIISGISEIPANVDVIVCPSFVNLYPVILAVKDSNIMVGAQNMYFEESGAFTGEVSVEMLKAVGCEYVILGHSERRTIFKESDDVINLKVKKALENEITPIFCIGETLEERESGITFDVIENQIKKGLMDINIDSSESLIIAYEPVWAIGTGRTATPEQAQEVHSFIRSKIADIFSDGIAEKIIIQYGGSVKPDNAESLLSKNDIDGALVGGASLKANDFIEIIKSVY